MAGAPAFLAVWALSIAAQNGVELVEIRDAAHVVVHFDDQARLPTREAEVLRRETEAVFRDAAIAVSWEAPLYEPVGQVACDGRYHIAVSLLRIAAPFNRDRTDHADVLGRAAPAYRRAWVFANRVQQVANGSVDAAVLMARALAHEIGHLLLPDGAVHAATGIMRQSLDPRDVRPRFTRAQAEGMRAAVASAVQTRNGCARVTRD